MKVLIADDDRVLTLLLATRLRALGWQVEVALDAMQTMMFAMRGTPDIIVLDINMPGGTGRDALDKLKRSTKTAQVPVVVLTGSIAPDDENAVLRLGAAAFLRKPVTPEELHATLSNIVGSPVPRIRA